MGPSKTVNYIGEQAESNYSAPKVGVEQGR